MKEGAAIGTAMGNVSFIIAVPFIAGGQLWLGVLAVACLVFALAFEEPWKWSL